MNKNKRRNKSFRTLFYFIDKTARQTTLSALLSDTSPVTIIIFNQNEHKRKQSGNGTSEGSFNICK